LILWKRSMPSSTAPPWKRLMANTPAATAAFSSAPVEATVRAVRTEGGLAPWSMEETKTASMSFPTSGVGSSPVKAR
jgi:hypothetical protein